MLRYCVLVLAVLAVTSCDETSGLGSTFGEAPPTAEDTSSREFFEGERLLVEANTQFRARNFGNAYTLYKRVLDVAPEDPNAWLGFAASSDMLRRFDKSDFAYAKLKPVIGDRVVYLNNFGYSQLLRGNLQAARQYFLRAYEIDPSNEITANNLEMLRNSAQFPRRAPGDLRGN